MSSGKTHPKGESSTGGKSTRLHSKDSRGGGKRRGHQSAKVKKEGGIGELRKSTNGRTLANASSNGGITYGRPVGGAGSPGR